MKLKLPPIKYVGFFYFILCIYFVRLSRVFSGSVSFSYLLLFMTLSGPIAKSRQKTVQRALPTPEPRLYLW